MAFLLLLTAAWPLAGQAQTNGTTVSGRILGTTNALPVPGAAIRLLNDAGNVVDTTSTASDGSFKFKNVAPGTYTVEIAAQGYNLTRTPPIVVASGQPSVDFQTAIAPGSSNLKEIAVVSVGGQQALQTTSTINKNLPPNIIQDQNYIRAGDALGTLPWVTNGTSSSLGDDESISIRGFNPTESLTLLDGHPIGPVGVKAGNSYDYQLAQFWGFSNINVIYGSGATGLYGVPTLAGAVDFQTLNPTPQSHFSFLQGYGDLGKLMTAATATGTFGHLGYALAYGVQGINGEIGPANILQSGLLNSGLYRCPGSPTAANYAALNGGTLPPSLTGADQAACSYVLSGNYLNRNIVGKLTYQLTPSTNIAVTAYNASMYASSPGNGDTDNQTAPFELNVANGILGAGNGSNNFQLLSGATTNCNNTTIAVLNDSPAGYTCLTAQQYANAFQGPAGGGLNRQHTAWNQDYHARLSQDIGPGTFVLDGFIDTYNFNNIKGYSPSPFYDDNYFTHGGLISYQISNPKNFVAAGIYFQNQLHETNSFNSAPILGGPFIGFQLTDTNYFVRDAWTPNQHLSVFADLTVERSFDTATTNWDPRLSVVYRPDGDNVFRVAAGRATGDPDPEIVQGGFSFGAINSFNPTANCVPLASIGSGNSPLLQPENANDVELTVAHRFPNLATLEVDAYAQVLQNPIISAVFPLSIVPAGQLPSAATLAQFTGALSAACGGTYTAADLGVSAPFNAGAAYYNGINFYTKVPLTRQFEIDGGYTIQVAHYTGLSNQILMNNLSLINGGQINGVPLQEANIGAGYNNLVGQWNVHMQAYYTGAPNPYDRPPYWYVNANLAKTISNITFNLGINNLFNMNASQWGLIGYGNYFPQNGFAPPGQTAITQGAEEYALPFRQVWLTASFHV